MEYMSVADLGDIKKLIEQIEWIVESTQVHDWSNHLSLIVILKNMLKTMVNDRELLLKEIEHEKYFKNSDFLN